MNLQNKTFLIIIVVVVLAGAFLFSRPTITPTGFSVGSVSRASEYYSTTTAASLGTFTVGSPTLLSDTSGTLGSVVILGAAAGQIYLYDATTTNSSLRTKSATTTLAIFPTSAAAGTYTFDAVFKEGLIVEFQTAMPTTTITWRQ